MSFFQSAGKVLPDDENAVDLFVFQILARLPEVVGTDDAAEPAGILNTGDEFPRFQRV